MIGSMKCIKRWFFVFNFLWVALAVYSLGETVYLIVTSPFEPKFIRGIIVPVKQIAIAFLGCFGVINENLRMVISYAALLMVIFVVEFAFGLNEVVNVYKNEHMARVDSWLSNFDNYWTDHSDQIMIDSLQSHELCCGSTGPSYWDKFPDKMIPWSCCGTDESVTCSETAAFTTGCVTILHDIFYRHCAPFIGFLTGLLAVNLVCFVFAVILAKSIRNHQRGTIRLEEMNRLN